MVRDSLLDKSVSQISWTAIASEMKQRSSDDIRHFWNQKLMPKLVPNQSTWTQEEDLQLLDFVSDEDLRGADNGCTLTQS